MAKNSKASPPLAAQRIVVEHRFGDSWKVRDWPTHVFPGSVKSGRHLVNCNCDSLMKAGALVRIGREPVVLGDEYRKWLAASEHRKAVTTYGKEGAP